MSQKPLYFIIPLICQANLSWFAAAQSLPSLATPAERLKILRNEALDSRLAGQVDQALDSYEEAIALAKKEFGGNAIYIGDLYFEMGCFAFEKDKFERAETYLNNAVGLNPNAVMSRVKLAELLRIMGRSEDAIRQLQQALRKHPNSIEARQALAATYLEINDPERANQEFYHFNAVLHGKNVPAPTIISPMPPAPAPEKPAPAIKQDETKKKEEPKRHTKQPVKAKAKPEKSRPEIQPKAGPEGKQSPPAKNTAKPALKPQPAKRPQAEARPDRSARKHPEGRGGLVPPPPPMIPAYPYVPPQPPNGITAGNPNYQLKTNVQIKTPEHPKEQSKAPAKEDKSAAAPSGSGQDDDFLLEWADKGGKKKGK